MQFIEIEDWNVELGRPRGWSEEQCHSVKAYIGHDGSGIGFTLTALMPSEEDKQAIMEGRPIYLKFCGIVGTNGQPTMMPAALFTLDEQGAVNL